jgi:hypothetical protein
MVWISMAIAWVRMEHMGHSKVIVEKALVPTLAVKLYNCVGNCNNLQKCPVWELTPKSPGSTIAFERISD